jgi:hypothetical protein
MFFDLRKQAELQCLHDPKRSNTYDVNNVRCENIRHFINVPRRHSYFGEVVGLVWSYPES